MGPRSLLLPFCCVAARQAPSSTFPATYCLTLAIWGQSSTDGNLQNCEPKQLFSFCKWINPSICDRDAKVTKATRPAYIQVLEKQTPQSDERSSRVPLQGGWVRGSRQGSWQPQMSQRPRPLEADPLSLLSDAPDRVSGGLGHWAGSFLPSPSPSFLPTLPSISRTLKRWGSAVR